MGSLEGREAGGLGPLGTCLSPDESQDDRVTARKWPLSPASLPQKLKPTVPARSLLETRAFFRKLQRKLALAHCVTPSQTRGSADLGEVASAPLETRKEQLM